MGEHPVLIITVAVPGSGIGQQARLDVPAEGVTLPQLREAHGLAVSRLRGEVERAAERAAEEADRLASARSRLVETKAEAAWTADPPEEVF